MEQINIIFEDAEFDKLVHENSLPYIPGTCTIAVKDKATVTKNPGAVIAFRVEVDGKVKTAQATVTLRQLKRALEMIQFRYPQL